MTDHTEGRLNSQFSHISFSNNLQSFANAKAFILSPFILSVCEIVHASFRIPFNPTRHFSYSSGSLSSTYLAIFSFACCLNLHPNYYCSEHFPSHLDLVPDVPHGDFEYFTSNEGLEQFMDESYG